MLGNDEYCRYCGTKRGEGEFKPYENFVPCVYGSPITYIHKCEKCGTEFQSNGMGGRAWYCYKCGSNNISEDVWDEKSLKCDIRLGNQGVHAVQGHGSETTAFEYTTYTVKHEVRFSSVENSTTKTEEIKIPDCIKTIDELVRFLQKEKPMWCLNYYVNNVKFSSESNRDPYPKHTKPPISPRAFATIDQTYENKNYNKRNVSEFMRSSGFRRPSDFHEEQETKKQKKLLLGLSLALGAAVCILLLILFNL